MPTRNAERDIAVYLKDQDLDEAPAFTAPRNWCQIKREAGQGKFVKHSKAFKLTGPVPVRERALASPGAQVRGQSAIVGQAIMHAFVDPGETEIEQRKHYAARNIVRGWKQDVAQRRHRASLAKRQVKSHES